MSKLFIAAAASFLAAGAFAQVPAPVESTPVQAAPVVSLPTASGEAPPRCSAELRDRCVQDERFARDVARPGGSRDNNAINYPTSAAARKRARAR